jgi:hypothetical protein
METGQVIILPPTRPKYTRQPMAPTPRTLPPVPWQITGNHWLTLPCIHPADASVHAIALLHRGSRSAVEFAGGPDFVDGTAPALLKPTLEIDGTRHELSSGQMAWERAFGWIPTFTCTVAGVVVRGTIFAPYGRDADVAGAVYALAIESRSSSDITVRITLDGVLGHRQLRVRTPRPVADAHRISSNANGVVLLEGASPPGLVAIAIGAEGDATINVDHARSSFSIVRTLRVSAGGREHLAFYIAAGPEGDGAEATVAMLTRRGWRELLTATRDALQSLEQTTGLEAMDRLINRNLLFNYFCSVGRALDDAHYYLVRTRIPWNGHGITIRDWEALMWIVPAVQLLDSSLARELLLRACELHGYAPGRGVNYIDGTLFEPGFTIEGAAAYALACDRYIRETGDDQIVDEAVLADTLYLSSEDINARRDRRVPLYASEVTLSGAQAPLPFTLHGNAVAALALDVLRRTLDEETARQIEDPEAVRAAVKRHFLVEKDAKSSFVTATDLTGKTSTQDDPVGSVFWLPLYDTVSRQDSAYRRTVKALSTESEELARQCARVLGPDASSVLQWMRRAPLDNGFAAELVDGEGRAEANGGDAALSGLLAWSAWYAVHALGERP